VEGRSLRGVTVENNNKIIKTFGAQLRFEQGHLPNTSPKRNLCAIADTSNSYVL
jgi:hypothetical protein